MNTQQSTERFECPYCRKQCTKSDILQDKWMDRRIEDRIVICENECLSKEIYHSDLEQQIEMDTNKGIGCKRKMQFVQTLGCSSGPQNTIKQRKVIIECGWKGSFKQWKQQHSLNCPFEMVMCIYCDEQKLRRDLENHYETCDFYLMDCLQCGEQQCRFEMQDHLKKDCPKTVVSCAHGCEEIFERSKQLEHDAKCLEKEISCAYQSFGCIETFKRKKQNEHCITNLQKHSKLVSSKVLTLERQLTMLTNVRVQQGREIETLQHSYNKLRRTLRDCIKKNGEGIYNLLNDRRVNRFEDSSTDEEDESLVDED